MITRASCAAGNPLTLLSIALTTTDVVDFAKKSFSQGILVNPTTKLVTY